MNKKVVLSVLSTALVTSMTTSAFALEAGLYIGGNVDKYYSIPTFVANEAAARAEINALSDLSKILYVQSDGTAANVYDIALADKMADVLKQVTLADFEGNVYKNAATGATYDPSTDPEVPGVTGELKVESVSAI
ncbi:sugar-binding domain protein, partial [Brevibacillus sp. NRS-1366]